jgi:hypothetical protein
VVTIVISGSYSLNTFREDLQKLYKRAGLKGEGLLFLLTDSQVGGRDLSGVPLDGSGGCRLAFSMPVGCCGSRPYPALFNAPCCLPRPSRRLQIVDERMVRWGRPSRLPWRPLRVPVRVQPCGLGLAAPASPAEPPLATPLPPSTPQLVLVNDLLASGEIPDLFAPEDRDEIVNAMRGETKAAGLIDTTENCWATFIGRVRAARAAAGRAASRRLA